MNNENVATIEVNNLLQELIAILVDGMKCLIFVDLLSFCCYCP